MKNFLVLIILIFSKSLFANLPFYEDTDVNKFIEFKNDTINSGNNYFYYEKLDYNFNHSFRSMPLDSTNKFFQKHKEIKFWKFECFKSNDSIHIAYFFDYNKKNSFIMYFFDNLIDNSDIIRKFKLDDDFLFKPINLNLKDYLDSNSLTFIQKLDLPLPQDKIPDSIKVEIYKLMAEDTVLKKFDDYMVLYNGYSFDIHPKDEYLNEYYITSVIKTIGNFRVLALYQSNLNEFDNTNLKDNLLSFLRIVNSVKQINTVVDLKDNARNDIISSEKDLNNILKNSFKSDDSLGLKHVLDSFAFTIIS
jgi:hypothetical protein